MRRFVRHNQLLTNARLLLFCQGPRRCGPKNTALRIAVSRDRGGGLTFFAPPADSPEPRSILRDLPDTSPHLANSGGRFAPQDRKSTRLNSSHTVSSYAVFCWQKTS